MKKKRGRGGGGRGGGGGGVIHGMGDFFFISLGVTSFLINFVPNPAKVLD